MAVDLSDAAQGIEDRLEAIETRLAALESATGEPGTDTGPLEARLAAVETFVADLKIVPLDEAFGERLGTAFVTAFDGADVVEAPE